MTLRKIAAAMGIATLVAATSPAHASFFGKDVLALCHDDAMACRAYVAGVFGGAQTVWSSSRLGRHESLSDSYSCTEHVVVGQLQDAVTKYIEAHPEFSQSDGPTLVLGAIYAAFKCQWIITP